MTITAVWRPSRNDRDIILLITRGDRREVGVVYRREGLKVHWTAYLYRDLTCHWSGWCFRRSEAIRRVEECVRKQGIEIEE